MSRSNVLVSCLDVFVIVMTVSRLTTNSLISVANETFSIASVVIMNRMTQRFGRLTSHVIN